MLTRLLDKLCDTINVVNISYSNNPAHIVIHYAFSFEIRFCGGSSTCISCIVLTKDYCSLYSSSQSATDFFLISSLSINTYSSITLFSVMAIFASTMWIKGFETLGSTLSLSFYWLHCFVFQHILHIIVLETIYDLMSSVTTNMTRIPNRLMYFNLLNSILKDYRNKVFLSFDSISFNIMIYPMTICTVHSYFFGNV